MFFHRFLIICLPSWLLAIAVGVTAIRQVRTRTLAIAGVCVLSLVSTMISYTRVREDWRGAANYLIDHATAQDRVLYYAPVWLLRYRELSRLAARRGQQPSHCG